MGWGGARLSRNRALAEVLRVFTHPFTHTLKAGIGPPPPSGQVLSFCGPNPSRDSDKKLGTLVLARVTCPLQAPQANKLPRTRGSAPGRGLDALRGVRRQGSKPGPGLVSPASPSPRGALIARPAVSRSQAVPPPGRRAAGCRTAARPAERPPASPVLRDPRSPGRSPRRRRRDGQTPFSWGCQAGRDSRESWPLN